MLVLGQTYASVVDVAVARLPKDLKVFEMLQEELQNHWISRSYMKNTLLFLLAEQVVLQAAYSWWLFLLKTLVENAKDRPSSKRAAKFELTRNEERKKRKNAFTHEPSIVAVVRDQGHPPSQVANILAMVFLAIDEVRKNSLGSLH